MILELWYSFSSFQVLNSLCIHLLEAVVKLLDVFILFFK